MPCEEWRRLVECYRAAVHAYNQAVNTLGVLPGKAFNENWSRAEEARALCNRHRADLWHHEHDHDCLEVGQPNRNQRTPPIETENMVLGDQGQSGG
jgi:hypothetical protein